MSKKTSIVTGVLFIICTAAGIGSVSMLGNVKQTSDLIAACQNETSFVIGVLLLLVMGLSGAGIAASIYPSIKDQCPSLAIASVVFRAMEGTMAVIGSVIYISMLSLYQSGTLTDLTGDLLITLKTWMSSYGLAMAFAVGAMMYYIAFIKTKQIPRWLSIFGLAGAIMHFIAIIFVAFGHNPFSPPLLMLNMPIALQEMILAIWLIVTGLRHREKHLV